MPRQQIGNPRSAFNYDYGKDGLRGEQVLESFRNGSSAVAIRPGDAVCRSTAASTDGKAVVVSTVDGNPLFVGVALTSASTGQSTQLSSNTPTSVWCQVVVQGPAIYNGILGETIGDVVAVLQGTVAGSSRGHLGAAATTQGTAGYIRVAGTVLTSATTGTTGFLSTSIPKGVVDLQPSFVLRTSV